MFNSTIPRLGVVNLEVAPRPRTTVENSFGQMFYGGLARQLDTDNDVLRANVLEQLRVLFRVPRNCIAAHESGIVAALLRVVHLENLSLIRRCVAVLTQFATHSAVRARLQESGELIPLVTALRPLFCSQNASLRCAVTDFARLVATSEEGANFFFSSGIMKELVKQVLPDEHSLPFHPAEFREERAPLSKISSKSRESFVCTEKDSSQHGGLSPGEYTIGAQNSPPIDKETAKENHGKRDSTWIRLRANRRVQRQWICLETQVPVRVGTHCRTRTSRHCVVECVYDMYLQRQQSKAAEEQTCGDIRGDERSCNGSGDPKTHRHGESVAANEVNILETKCKDYRKSLPVAAVAVLQEQKKAPPEGSECIVATVQELSAARMRHEDTKLTRDYLEDNAYSSGHLVGCQSNPYHENATHYHDSKMGKVTAGDGVVKQERDWYGSKLKESKGEHRATVHPSSEGGQNRETTLGTAGRDQTIKSWRLLRIKHPLHQVWVALEGEMWTRSGRSWQLFPVMQLVVLRNLEEDQDLRRKADYASGAAPLSAVTADSDKTRNCSDTAGKTYPDNGRLDENHTFSQQKPGTAARELTEGEQAHISAKKNSSAHIQSVKDQKLASAGSYIQAPLFPLLSQMASTGRIGSDVAGLPEEPTQLKEYLNSHQALHRLERSTSAASAYLFLEGDLAARISSLRLLTTVGVYSPDALRELVQLPHGSLISLFFDAFAPYEIPSFQNKQSRSADAFSDGITCLGLSEDSEAPPQRTRKSNIEAVLEFVLALCKDEGVRKSLVDKGLVPLVGNLLTVMLEKRFPLVCVSGDSSASIYNADEPPTNYRDWGFSLHPRTQPDCVTAGKGFLLIQILQDNEKAKELKEYFAQAIFSQENASYAEVAVATFDSCRRQAVALLSALCLQVEGKQQCAAGLLPLVTALCFLETDPSSLAQALQVVVNLSELPECRSSLRENLLPHLQAMKSHLYRIGNETECSSNSVTVQVSRVVKCCSRAIRRLLWLP